MFEPHTQKHSQLKEHNSQMHLQDLQH